jgi:hypothetical protein
VLTATIFTRGLTYGADRFVEWSARLSVRPRVDWFTFQVIHLNPFLIFFKSKAWSFHNRGLTCGADRYFHTRGLTCGADRYFHARGLTCGADRCFHTRGLTYGADRYFPARGLTCGADR